MIWTGEKKMTENTQAKEGMCLTEEESQIANIH